MSYFEVLLNAHPRPPVHSIFDSHVFVSGVSNIVYDSIKNEIEVPFGIVRRELDDYDDLS